MSDTPPEVVAVLRELVELRAIKRKIEARTATDEERERYKFSKQKAWNDAEGILHDSPRSPKLLPAGDVTQPAASDEEAINRIDNCFSLAGESIAAQDWARVRKLLPARSAGPWVWWEKSDGYAVGPRDEGAAAIVFTIEEAQGLCKAFNTPRSHVVRIGDDCHALKDELQRKYPDPIPDDLRLLYYMEAAEEWGQLARDLEDRLERAAEAYGEAHDRAAEMAESARAESAPSTTRHCTCYVLPHEDDCEIFVGITQSGERVIERRSGVERRASSVETAGERRLRHRIEKIDAALDELGAPKAGNWDGINAELSQVGRIRALVDGIRSFHAARSARAMSPRIVFRPLLVTGILADSDAGPMTLIDSEMPESEQAIAIWHEAIHFLLRAAGRELHDEASVEAMAQRLAAAGQEIVPMLAAADRESPP